MEKKDQEKMDNYLTNKMPSEERRSFEQLLQSDSGLAKDFAAHKEAFNLAREMGDHQARLSIKKVMDNAIVTESPKKNNWPTIALVAFFLGALLLGLFYFLQPEKSTAPEAPKEKILYASNYQPYPVTFGGRGEGAAEILAAASIAYKEKDYSKALQLFDQLPQESVDGKVALAKGICQMELQQFETAKNLFLPMVDDPLYGKQCRWYLALTLLHQGDPGAKEQFQLVANTNGEFQEAAKKILLELK